MFSDFEKKHWISRKNGKIEIQAMKKGCYQHPCSFIKNEPLELPIPRWRLVKWSNRRTQCTYFYFRYAGFLSQVLTGSCLTKQLPFLVLVGDTVGKVGVTLNLSVNKRVRSWFGTDFEKIGLCGDYIRCKAQRCRWVPWFPWRGE